MSSSFGIMKFPIFLEKCQTGWWLGHPSEKYDFVNWDDDIPNISGKIKLMFQTTNQQTWQPVTTNHLDGWRFQGAKRYDIWESIWESRESTNKIQSCGRVPKLSFVTSRDYDQDDQLLISYQIFFHSFFALKIIDLNRRLFGPIFLFGGFHKWG